ncbi:acetate--CoA ligase family protein [Sneathiella marina]|uniref:Acetate--CoA ligase family protein n=1 Tax=Sneathiella marina TaxID=2950108 RepID=A0ABY4W195_9PROT|nr:acetate--CoA ligase family protein [Sneathiella marina]USG60729.1 acetate--CoA ligase family protein [Sneathiella marina]
MTHSLEAMLRPKSVAIIGASDTPSRIGGRPINSMKTLGFKGDIYPVNPKWETIQDLPAFGKIQDVPKGVDCAIIAVPAKIAVQSVRDCADQGVKSAVMFTSGFAELSDDGAKAQREITGIAKESGMRLIGPNCLGVFNVDASWYGTFTNAPGMLRLPPGPMGIVSQSGAYGAHVFMVSQLRGVGSNYWVTTGNESDVDVAEVIEFYAQAPDVKVILAYAEGMKDADRICKALEMARDAEKPVIFMKVGSTDVGAQAAASHTASLAGADAVYDALFKQYGVYRAETTEEFVDVAYACQYGRYPTGRKIDLQTISGGVGVQMADASVKYELDVAPLPVSTQKKLKELIPFAGVTNPVDFTAQALNDPSLMEANISMTIDEADFDAHIVYMASVPASPFTKDICKQIFTNIREKYADEIMMMSIIGPDEVVSTYEDLGIPCYEDPSLAVRAMASLMHFGEVFERGRPDAPPALPTGALPAPTTPIAEHEAKRVLNSIGVPVTTEELVQSREEAVAVWQKIGGKVVMKIASPDILHKTEIGGVLLSLDTAEEVAAGFDTLIERAKTAKPDAKIDGVIVAEMVSGGVETVMGVVCDPVFGPAVMFGLGGVFVEVLKDVTFRLAPFGVDEAHRMIDEIQGRAMLDGVRGAPPSDIEALAEALSKLSVFAATNADTIETIDVNPFIVLPNGAVAVDALIVPKVEN